MRQDLFVLSSENNAIFTSPSCNIFRVFREKSGFLSAGFDLQRIVTELSGLSWSHVWRRPSKAPSRNNSKKLVIAESPEYRFISQDDTPSPGK